MARSPAIIALAAAVVLGTARAAAADLLLVERPGSLVILDRYQQTMSPQARRRLVPFAPMIVRNASAHLGDGITPCLAVEIDGEPGFVITDERGELAGRSQAGFVALVRDAALVADTVELVTPLDLNTPDHGTVRRLPAGERLAVLFTAGKDTYVHRLNGGFGWVAPPAIAWRSVRSGEGLPPAVQHRELEIIRASLDGANTVFASLVKHLGLSASYPGGGPRWEVEEGPDAIVCVLTGLRGSAGENFTESTDMLARELQTLLLGRGMGVSSRPGLITIRYLNGAQETH